MSPLIGLVGEAVADGHVVDDLVRLVQQTLPHAPAAILVPLPEAVNQLHAGTEHNSSISSSPTVNAELHSYKQLKKGMFWSSATQPLE